MWTIDTRVLRRVFVEHVAYELRGMFDPPVLDSGRMPRMSKWDRWDSAAKNHCAHIVPLVTGETIQVIANTQIGCTVLNRDRGAANPC